MTAAIVLACGLIAGCSKSSTSAESAAAEQAPPMTAVEIPKLQHSPGDREDPLPADAPYPSDNPRDLEGIWVGIGRSASADGQPPPLSEQARANRARMMASQRDGLPRSRRGTLCRPPSVINFVNQFPIQFLQRPETVLVITEELRGIWQIHMDKPLPAQVEPSYGGYNAGHWEGNTLVIESIGFRPGQSAGPDGVQGSGVKVTTRITRASNGDKRNGDRLVIRRTTENPNLYTRPYTEVSVARWRPDLEMLEFNCEESTPAEGSAGLIVE